jgi:hypothetical protein
VTTITEAIQACALGYLAHRAAGSVSMVRVVAGPAAGALAMVAVALLAGDSLPAFLAAGAAYVLVTLLVERRLYPADVERFTGLVRARLGRA